MPSKLDKVNVGENLDRRRKLSEEQKEEIKNKYSSGTIGQRQLAKEYGVSRKLIQIIVNPDIAEKTKQRMKDHWKEYYDKDKHREAIANLRKYKKELNEKGQLTKEE